MGLREGMTALRLERRFQLMLQYSGVYPRKQKNLRRGIRVLTSNDRPVSCLDHRLLQLERIHANAITGDKQSA